LAQFYSASWLLPDIFLSGRCWARHRSDFKRLFVADEPPPFHLWRISFPTLS
jgi:hypothetical protein